MEFERRFTPRAYLNTPKDNSFSSSAGQASLLASSIIDIFIFSLSSFFQWQKKPLRPETHRGCFESLLLTI